jgi:hypothetical protein
VDTKSRVIGVCAGSPDDSSWERVHRSLGSEIEEARETMHFAKKDLKHRRADTPAAAVGVSYGGGQAVGLFQSPVSLGSNRLRLQVPGVLVNYGINAAILASLLSNANTIRIAGFASGRPSFPHHIHPSRYPMQPALRRGRQAYSHTMLTTFDLFTRSIQSLSGTS